MIAYSVLLLVSCISLHEQLRGVAAAHVVLLVHDHPVLDLVLGDLHWVARLDRRDVERCVREGAVEDAVLELRDVAPHVLVLAVGGELRLDREDQLRGAHGLREFLLQFGDELGHRLPRLGFGCLHLRVTVGNVSRYGFALSVDGLT